MRPWTRRPTVVASIEIASPGWRASPSRNIGARWGTGQCRHLRSRSSDGYPLITLPDLCGSGARDPARVVRDMWWSRSFFDRDGGLV